MAIDEVALLPGFSEPSMIATKRFEKTGQVLIVADLGHEYGFADVDGRQPGPLADQMGL